MQHRDGSFEGAAGHSIYYQYWTPEEPPRAVLLIVHGAGPVTRPWPRISARLDMPWLLSITSGTENLMAPMATWTVSSTTWKPWRHFASR